MDEIVKELNGKDLFVLKSQKAALLVIDMQNSFIEDGAVFQAPNGQKIIPNIEKIINFCRSKEMPIIWTRSDHSPPGGGLIIEKYPVIKLTKELWKGTHSFEYYPGMIQPDLREHQIIKHKYDAFIGTDLDIVLRNYDVDTVIIVGVATEVCCESTARTAFFKDYKVILLSDATAAFNPVIQEETLKRIHSLFGRVLTTDEAISEMKKSVS